MNAEGLDSPFKRVAQSAGVVEDADCISAEG